MESYIHCGIGCSHWSVGRMPNVNDNLSMGMVGLLFLLLWFVSWGNACGWPWRQRDLYCGQKCCASMGCLCTFVRSGWMSWSILRSWSYSMELFAANAPKTFKFSKYSRTVMLCQQMSHLHCVIEIILVVDKWNNHCSTTQCLNRSISSLVFDSYKSHICSLVCPVLWLVITLWLVIDFVHKLWTKPCNIWLHRQLLNRANCLNNFESIKGGSAHWVLHCVLADGKTYWSSGCVDRGAHAEEMQPSRHSTVVAYSNVITYTSIKIFLNYTHRKIRKLKNYHDIGVPSYLGTLSTKRYVNLFHDSSEIRLVLSC